MTQYNRIYNLFRLQHNWKNLTSLESLSISLCPGLTSLSSTPTPLGGATRHQSNPVDLDFSYSEELDLSKYHESSGGKNNLIIELHSLRSVILAGLPKLASLAQWLLQLSNLEHLTIWTCKELDLCKDESGDINILDSHGRLQNLRSVNLECLPKLASLPRWLLQLRNVEHRVITECYNLKDLQELEALKSLQRVEIAVCPSLTSLPKGMRRLASLTYLSVFGCPELEWRCKRDGREDWHMITHIPRITHERFSPF